MSQKNHYATEKSKCTILSGDKKPVLAIFHAVWCGFCVKTAPEWNKARQAVHKKGHAWMKAFESDDCPDLIEKYDIRGFPTIKLFLPNGEVIPFSDQRTAESFISFIQHHTTQNKEVKHDDDDDDNDYSEAEMDDMADFDERAKDMDQYVIDLALTNPSIDDFRRKVCAKSNEMHMAPTSASLLNALGKLNIQNPWDELTFMQSSCRFTQQ